MDFEQNNNKVLNMNTPKNDVASGQPPQVNEQLSQNNPPTGQEDKQSTGGYIWEVVKFFILAVIVVAPIRFFIAQPFIVQGASMDPTFATGQYLIIDEISYRFNEPERGNVIVLRYPKNPSKFFIKRLVGLPGDTLTLKNGVVSIATEQDPEPFILDEPYITFPKTDGKDDEVAVLGEGEYFVMGDNRASSSDSREWGILPRDNIVGQALVRLFPIGTASFFPGQTFD